MIQNRRPASGLLRWATWRNAIACRPLRTKRNRTSAARHRPRPSPPCRSLRRRARCMLYIYRNRRRMRYSQFRKQGLCTAVRPLNFEPPSHSKDNRDVGGSGFWELQPTLF